MRSIDAVVGETYALRSRPQIKVEMLETPPEVRSARRMRVRFQNGVKAGKVCDLPSVGIIPLPGRETRQVATQPRSTSHPRAPARGSLRVGATVTVQGDKTGFHWTVKRMCSDGKAEIETTIFKRRTGKTVSCDRLQLVGALHRLPRRGQTFPDPAPERGDDFDQAEWISENLRPIQPRRDLDEVLDSLVFSNRCLQSYRDRFNKGHSTAESADRLRGEIRARGVIERDDRRGMMYGRICVPHRFDVTLPDEFRVGVATTIDDPTSITDRRRRRSARPSSKRRSRKPSPWKGRAAA